MTLLAPAAVLLMSAPVAMAEPEPTKVVPEGPVGEATTVFADDPSIVDPRPMTIEHWSRSADPNAVTVHFTTGVPDCSGVHASALETPESVTIDLLGGTPPPAVGRACIMLAVSGTLEVPLQAPLGQRTVLTTALDKP